MAVSFTREIREELVHRTVSRTCCRQAEVAALVRTAGSLHILGGGGAEDRYALHVTSTVQGAAGLVYTHFKSFGIPGQLRVLREPRFKRRLVYEVHIPGSPAALQVLNELGIITDRFRIESGVPARLLRRRCCRAAFVRGCLIGAGSVSAPSREAHLEVVTPHESFAEDLAVLLQGLGFPAGTHVRRGTQVLYVKGRDTVAQVLAFIGAQDAALRVAEQAVLKDVRSRANRVANCDAANLRRTSRASRAQLEAIDRLDRAGRLGRLPRALREAAEIRRQYPYSSLAEIAEESDAGISRSALNHRLRRLLEAAEDLG